MPYALARGVVYCCKKNYDEVRHSFLIATTDIVAAGFATGLALVQLPVIVFCGLGLLSYYITIAIEELSPEIEKIIWSGVR